MGPTGNEPGKMRHVDEQQRADLVGDRAHTRKVEDTRVRAAAANDELGAFALGRLFEQVIVNLLRVLAYAVRDHAIELAGEIELVPVGKMATVRQVEAENGVARLDD